MERYCLKVRMCSEKNPRLYYYWTSSRIVFVRFLGELKTPKRHFEINWHLVVHMQLQNSFAFVMVYLRFPPTLSVQTAICITIPINIHRCQLIGKVILILQWDQSHFVIELYILRENFQNTYHSGLLNNIVPHWHTLSARPKVRWR